MAEKSILLETGLLQPTASNGFAHSNGDRTLIKFKCGKEVELTDRDLMDYQEKRTAEINEASAWGIPLSLVISRNNEIRRMRTWLREIHDGTD